MSDIISKGYFVTKDNQIIYAENWYDADSDYIEFNDGLNVYSDMRDMSSWGDGKEYKSLSGLFCTFLQDGQFNIKKLAKLVEEELIDYIPKEYEENIEEKNINGISEEDLKEMLEQWSLDYDIPSFVFSQQDLFTDNFPYCCKAVRIRNYSNAGDYFFDIVCDDNPPDMVFWVDYDTIASIGVSEENIDTCITQAINTFGDWINGHIFGITYQIWDEDEAIWSEEESIGGFLGDEYYDIVEILKEESSDSITEVASLDEANEKTGLHAFDVSYNNGVRYERSRTSKKD